MERQVFIYYSDYCGNSTSLCLGFIFFLGGGGSTNLADSAFIPYRQALRTTRHVKLSHACGRVGELFLFDSFAFALWSS